MSLLIFCRAIVAIIIPNIGGIAGAIVTKQATTTWYESLKRPSWRPPNWVFGPVWTTLYCSMGFASYLVYRDGNGFEGAARLPLIVYGSNLIFNWAWTLIFFAARRIDLALYEMQLINATAVATCYLFHQINTVAGYLIVPYCLWLSVATLLNYTIWRDNRGGAKIKKGKNK